LRSVDYRRVYERGFRVPGPYFLAFCLVRPDDAGPRIGITVPRALGKAVVRNRIKRRIRESARRQLKRLGPQWDVVFNPRRSALDAPAGDLEREVEKVFARCRAS
jgi:ribonuclease P protein component